MATVQLTLTQRMVICQETTDRWVRTIETWLGSLDHDEETDADVQAFEQYLRSLNEMLMGMAHTVAPRDGWEPFWSGSTVIVRSKKLAHDFYFEVCDLTGRFCMTTHVGFASHLKSMPDDFWRILLELTGCGTLEFEPNRGSDKSKSIIWRMVQEYALLARDPDETLTDSFIDFGDLRVVWPRRMPLAEVYSRSLEAFTKLYRLNYMLYRSEYIAKKSREKRHCR